MFDEAYISLIFRSRQATDESHLNHHLFACFDVANEPILFHIQVRKTTVFKGTFLEF